MWEYNYSNELCHYGVKGMKWGVRRARKLQDKANMHRMFAKDYDPKDYIGRKPLKAKEVAKMKTKMKEQQDLANKYQTKANKMVEKRYTKAGKKAGAAEYEREKGNKSYEAHEKNAKALDAMAKKYDAAGQIAKAELARRSASALRARGENVRAEQYKVADAYMKRSDKLNKKASDFAKEANVKLGKNKVDEIIKQSKQKGYDNAKSIDELNREMAVYDALGDKGYDAYRYVRGK